MEVECTHCGGRMLVEQISGVVACPHCGTHLAVPSSFDLDGRSSVLTEIPADVGEVTQVGRPVDPPAGSVLQTSLPLEPSDQLPEPTPDPPSIPEPADAETSNGDDGISPSPAQSDSAVQTTDAADAVPIVSDPIDARLPEDVSPSEEPMTFPVLEAASRPPDVVEVPTLSDSHTIESTPTESAPTETAPTETAPVETAATDTVPAESRPFETTPVADSLFPPLTTSQSPRGPTSSTADVSVAGEAAVGSVRPAIKSDESQELLLSAAASPAPRGVSRFLFLLIASYASAATLAIIILIISLLRARQHSLESLPDLKPPVHNGKTAFQLVPENAPMPPGHLLRLGESQRFGSLRVTPLRVTRGPVEFVYFSDEPGHRRLPTPPTLKLWLRFENVSDDQTFEPLGRVLVLTRIAGKRPPHDLRANNFVCRADDKRRDGHRVLLFDLARDSNWDLRGQDVDHPLKPGETWETYLASEVDGVDELTGALIWRVQFRKGYNRQSQRGVTTLIEVRFSSQEVEPDTTG